MNGGMTENKRAERGMTESGRAESVVTENKRAERGMTESGRAERVMTENERAESRGTVNKRAEQEMRENGQTEESMMLSMKTTRRQTTNEMEIFFDAVSCNESFARVAVAAFIAHLNPTVEELADVRTAVSEAVTNAIIHGYENFFGYGKYGERQPVSLVIHPGKVRLKCSLQGDLLHVEVEDKGKGIADVEQAMEPMYTTKPDLDRSGMGFAFMEAFMDDLEVESKTGQGTLVRMQKKLGTSSWIDCEE